MNALLFLFWRQKWNAVRRAVRQPRILIPGLVIAGFLALQLAALLLLAFSGSLSAVSSTPAFTRTDLLVGGPGAFLLALRGIFLLSLFSAMNTALGEGNLFFKQSDIDFLFPAPLSRRRVLLTRLLGRYLGLLIPAVYLPLTVGGAALAGSARVSPLAFWPGFLGAWLYLATVTNISQTIALNRSPDRDEDEGKWGRRFWRRVLTGLILALVALTLFLLFRFLSGEGVVDVGLFARAVHSEAINRTFLPDAWATDLFRVAFTGWELWDVARLAGLALLCLLSFVWLFARDRDFYEAATETSARRARVTEAMQNGNVGALLSQMARDGQIGRGYGIPELGGGAWAIFWKDALALTRAPLRSWVQLLFLACLPALAGGVFGRQGDVNVLFWGGMFALQMSSLFLLSLRDVLRRADVSKSLPVPPWKFLIAELSLSVAQLTLLGWFSLGVMALTGLGRGPLVGVGALVLPTLAALLLLVQTSLLLLYPNSGDAAQHFVGSLLSLLASVIAITPGIVTGMVLHALAVPWWLITAGVATVNLLGAGLSLLVAATLWRRFDPTD